GWQFGGILTFQSGNPFTVYNNINSSQQNNFLDRADVLGPVQVFHDPRTNRTFSPSADGTHGNSLGGPTTANFYCGPGDLDCAHRPMFTYGTMGRRVVRGPGITNWDLSLLKKTNIPERQSIEFRAEFFTAWNHAQFSNPDGTGFDGT